MATKKELEQELARLRADMAEACEEIDRAERALDAANVKHRGLKEKASAVALELDRLKPMSKTLTEFLLSAVDGRITYAPYRGMGHRARKTRESGLASELLSLGYAEVTGWASSYTRTLTLTNIGRAKAEEIKAKQK